MLDNVISKYGTDIINTFDKVEYVKPTFLSTGIAELDYTLGGGWPLGYFLEIYGTESVGKSTFCALAIKTFQAASKTCVYIDVEQKSLTPDWMIKNGVGVSRLYYVKPDTAEQAWQIAIDLTKSGIDLIIIDSLAAMVPEREKNSDSLNEAFMGVKAKLIKTGLNRIHANRVKQDAPTVICTNQVLEKFNASSFEYPYKTPGGMSIRFICHMIIRMQAMGYIKSGSSEIGRKTKIFLEKNKLGIPRRDCILNILYEHGIDDIVPLIEKAVLDKVIKKNGHVYTLNGIKCSGLYNFVDELRKDRKSLSKLMDLVVDK